MWVQVPPLPMGRWYNGITPLLQGGYRGSIPLRSITVHGRFGTAPVGQSLFLQDSSAVEHLTLIQGVVGSNPTLAYGKMAEYG